MPRHLRALKLALSRTNEQQLTNAMRSGDAEVLLAEVYPVERPFELLDNYVGELASIALEFVGEEAQDAVRNLRRLADLGGVSRSRAAKLIDVHRVRNALAHEYPDVIASRVVEAAEILGNELGAFLNEYTRWFVSALGDI